MLNLLSQHNQLLAFEVDTYDWFTGRYHGHMGKWQYMESSYDGDPVRGAELWDVWEQEASKGDNMLKRQGLIIQEQIEDLKSLNPHCQTIIDLGPGGKSAVFKNTLPFIKSYNGTLKNYVAIDISKESAINAQKQIQDNNSSITCDSLHNDFLDRDLKIPCSIKNTALMMGGTIGNFEAEPNTANAITLMANRIRELKHSMPKGTIIYIGLESTQNPEILYGDYDHPAHAEYEINVMHAIKRDLLSDQDGFDPYAWKYSMKWWPDSYQFCHIAEATELQRFQLLGEEILFPKGMQLVVDNSFKFPVLPMQRSAQLAKTEYLKSFVDSDNRMAIHALRL